MSSQWLNSPGTWRYRCYLPHHDEHLLVLRQHWRPCVCRWHARRTPPLHQRQGCSFLYLRQQPSALRAAYDRSAVEDVEGNEGDEAEALAEEPSPNRFVLAFCGSGTANFAVQSGAQSGIVVFCDNRNCGQCVLEVRSVHFVGRLSSATDSRLQWWILLYLGARSGFPGGNMLRCNGCGDFRSAALAQLLLRPSAEMRARSVTLVVDMCSVCMPKTSTLKKRQPRSRSSMKRWRFDQDALPTHSIADEFQLRSTSMRSVS